MLQGLVTAVRTLTILPVPGSDAPDMSRALPWFPMVGALLGLLAWALASVVGFVTDWPAGTALVAVAASVLLTRGLHLDGLADWADGFGGGGRDKDRILTIMKDSHVGAFGVVALVMVLLSKWVACFRLTETDLLLWLIVACIVSRTAMVELSTCLPYARAEGGTAAPFVASARPSDRFKAWALALLLVVIAGGVAGVVMLMCGWVFCRLMGLWFLKRAGGVTGDLLGACCELTETVLLLALAAWGGPLTRLFPSLIGIVQ